jgi:hypothetical protein
MLNKHIISVANFVNQNLFLKLASVVTSKAVYIILKMIKNLRHQFKDSARKVKFSSDVKHFQNVYFWE